MLKNTLRAQKIDESYALEIGDIMLTERNESLSDELQGIYRKFIVTRVDGKDGPGLKHDGCNYFVLDLTHDKYANAALTAYARACEKEYPELAKDLWEKINT